MQSYRKIPEQTMAAKDTSEQFSNLLRIQDELVESIRQVSQLSEDYDIVMKSIQTSISSPKISDESREGMDLHTRQWNPRLKKIKSFIESDPIFIHPDNMASGDSYRFDNELPASIFRSLYRDSKSEKS